MIENYFTKGATFTWAPPAPITGNNDGIIVAAGSAAPPALTFLGWDDVIPYSAQAPTLGLQKNANVPYHWLDYVHFRTAYVEPGARDVLTGFMSGCWICKWNEPGLALQKRVGHIGTVETVAKNQPPNTTVKTTFINNVGAHGLGLSGYNPGGAWDLPELMPLQAKFKTELVNTKILSLVTAIDDFYAIAMIHRINKNIWVCGGKKKIGPSDRANTILALQ